MKFEIKNRWSGKVQFTAEIECSARASISIKRGLAVKLAYAAGADLTGADLTGAVLAGAVLTSAVLTGADLAGADLAGADLTGAVLRGAVLTGADLAGADLTGILESVPLIPNIDAAILAAIAENKAKKQNGFDMGSWHGNKEDCDETNWCQTTHCRAGYAICLAGKAGFDLERKYGPANAGMLLYLKSTPNEPVPNWAASNSSALADMRERAKKQLTETT
jgi:uncharacterized protein YjbI with pentapeptide repeats